MSSKRKKKKSPKKKKAVFSKKKAGPKKIANKKVSLDGPSAIPVIFKNRVEFFRNGMALVSGYDEPDDWAVYLVNNSTSSVRAGCSCNNRSCVHLEKISEVHRTYRALDLGLQLDDSLRESIFYKLALPLIENAPVSLHSLKLKEGIGSEGDSSLDLNYAEIQDSTGVVLLTYLSDNNDFLRFAERFCLPTEHRDSHRGAVLQELARQTLTENEQVLQIERYCF